LSEGFHLTGRVLWLCEESELMRAQLEPAPPGHDLALDGVPPGALRDRVSTDEITPAWACYYFDATLARY
jgi:3-isopropylmalate/(R)-2-methylmalate dehydratase large subunit